MAIRSDLDTYLDTLYLERGLSEPTLRAYRVDLEGADSYARSLNKTIDELSDADHLALQKAIRAELDGLVDELNALKP